MTRYLVQDIETIPESEIASEWTPTQAEIDKAKPNDPFPPIWTMKVISIGMLALDKDLKPKKGGCAAGGLSSGKSEKEMIERWSAAASGELFKTDTPLKMVDWNGRGFDVPVLQTRAFRYGVQLPWYFGKLPDNRGEISQWSKKYRDRYQGRHLDLSEWWNNHGAFYRPHLANLAMLMGLPGKTDMDGAGVHDAYKAERFDDIDRYCMQDVFQTAFIFQRAWHLAGKLSLEAYREAATALRDWIGELPEHKDFHAAIDAGALFLETV